MTRSLQRLDVLLRLLPRGPLDAARSTRSSTAIPSMHVAFALVVGPSLAKLVRHPVLRLAWWAYPILVTFVIVATANHVLTDAVLGALVAGLPALAAHELARTRPAVWHFGRTPAVT